MSELNYQYSWQNRDLRETIYPFRNPKLCDFLMVYYEIDLWREAKNGGGASPEVAATLASVATQLQNEHNLLEKELDEAIAAKAEVDKWFAAVTGRDEKNLRIKQIYYLDREISRLTDKHAERLGRQKSTLKKVDWYPEGDTRRQRWIDRAAELQGPISEVEEDLNKVKYLRELFDKQDRLPKLDPHGGVSLEAAVRWKLLNYRQELDNLNHDKLLDKVLTRFEQEPERFEKWLQYMVIHFSGMRYRSAHASWADPKFLLELLTREFVMAEIQSMDEATVVEECREAIEELEVERDNTDNEKVVKAINQQISALNFWSLRRSLLDYRMAREIGEIQNLPDDEDVFLDRLEQLKIEKEEAGDPIPDWAWDEIMKYTSLRLKTQEKGWEAYSPERWKWENRRWTAILNTWERKDITGWRKQHADTLDLIVTRAVCNEIAEHIQHLRGINPAAGLSSKPNWYWRMQENTKELPEGDPKKAYIRRAPKETDFVNGASILWLGWVNRQPNAWQVARSFGRFNLLPSGVNLGKNKTKNTTEWTYNKISNDFIRTRRKATIQELKRKGKSKAEIEAIRKDMRKKGGFVKQYLRWTHEAIVVGVEEMIDGKFVLTFETGQIGLILRRLSDLRGNRNVFIGHVAPAEDMPKELEKRLDEMISRENILPTA